MGDHDGYNALREAPEARKKSGAPDCCLPEGSWRMYRSCRRSPMPASVASTVSALTLFPGWEDIGPWDWAGVQGLTEGQLDFAAPAPAPEWLWWSIRRHISHTARVVSLWLFSIWGDTLWGGHPPRVG